ncbi:MAG: hypothetical protein ABGY24_10715 [bacterium]
MRGSAYDDDDDEDDEDEAQPVGTRASLGVGASRHQNAAPNR